MCGVDYVIVPSPSSSSPIMGIIISIIAGISSLASTTSWWYINLDPKGAIVSRRDRQAVNGGGRHHKCGERP